MAVSIVTRYEVHLLDTRDLTATLNEFAAQGWRTVGISYPPHGRGRPEVVFEKQTALETT